MVPIIAKLRSISEGYGRVDDRLAENAVGQLADDLEAVMNVHDDGERWTMSVVKLDADIHTVENLRHLGSDTGGR